VVGVLIGFGLFCCSFGLIWYNEGRPNMADVAADSVGISTASVSNSTDGQMVAATGVLQAAEPIGDPMGLRPGDYISLNREVQMYAWVEKSKSNTETNTGGSQTTTTEYTYEKDWVSSPANSDNFKEPRGHNNPSSMPYEQAEFLATAAQVGAYELDLGQLSLPSAETVALNSANVVDDTRLVIAENYLFEGSGSLNSPQVGDVRIQYTAVPSGINTTVFGQQEGGRIVPYWHDGDNILYQAHEGSRADGLAAMESSYKAGLWGLRIGSFVAMWMGLMLIVGPVTTFLDVLPFLGRLGRGMIGVIAFGVAFVFWFVATVLSALLQSIWGLILAIVIVAGLAYFFLQRQKKSEGKLAGSEL
jgi:hypothetical protein